MSVFLMQANAQQIKFEMTPAGQTTQFYYQWKDHNKQIQTLQFKLDNNSLYGMFKKFRLYQPHLAQRYIYVSLKKYIATLHQKHVRVRLINRPHDLKILVNAQDPNQKAKVLRQLMQIKQNALAEYLQQNTYSQITDSYGAKLIKPDHMRIAKESLEFVSPIAHHIPVKQQGYITREAINYLLSWIQSIPYSTLEDRNNSQGQGFSPPNKLLFQNQGDCDSKSTLFAAIMRAFVPNLGIIIVYLPDHALIGLQIPYSKADEYLEIDGNYYVLAEPTGPALLPLAKISTQTKKAITNHSFSAESMP